MKGVRLFDGEMLKMNEILKLIPAYKDYIWGGNRLKSEYNKNSPYRVTAESWELSCHENGLSYVSGGKYDGMTLEDAINEAKAKGEDWLGTKCGNFEQFPVLIKLIDANASLSIQVHPDDSYAKINENGSLGKTEVWYIVEAEPDAELIYGLAKDVTKEEIKEAILKNELKPYLNSVKVKPGDVFFVRAGLLHAIGKGILICEIQQNSDTTYRVYDWGRVGTDGKPRELHIEKALDVLCLSKEEKTDFSPKLIEQNKDAKDYLIADCEYFKVVKREQLKESEIKTDGMSFLCLTFLKGDGEIVTEEQKCNYKKGDSFFIPAVKKEYKILGESQFLVTKV